MKIHINDISKKLNKYNIQTSFENDAISNIDSTRYLMPDTKEFQDNTIYITEYESLNINDLEKIPLNLLLISKESSVLNLFAGTKKNIIQVYENNISVIFNEVLDILLEIQKLSNDTSLLMEALSSGKGIDYIVEVGSALLGNPMFIRDVNFTILSFTKNVTVDDVIWNELTEKGYQSYIHFQYLKKHGFIELSNKVKMPIYNKIVDSINNPLLVQGSREVEIFSNFKYLLFPRFDTNENVSCSRVWCKISSAKNTFGELVVLESFKPFTDYDFALIKILSDTLSLELQKNSIYDKSKNKKQDLVIKDLFDSKINDSDSLNEQLKITGLKFKPFLKVIVFESTNQDESSMSTTYIKGLLNSVLGDVFCLFYDGYIVAIYNSKLDLTFTSSQIEQLYGFSKDAEMFCGISRTFINLFEGKKHFFLALEAINSGKRIKKDKLIYFFDEYVLQHMFNIYSQNESIQNLCLPSLITLIEYDKNNNTDYYSTLCQFVMKFKNPSDLANSLNIHRNTLYYRLSKIEDIMGTSLSNIDTLFSVYMSIKIVEYTEGESGLD